MTATDNVVRFSNSKLDIVANRIRSLGKQSVANVIEIGKLLIEAKVELNKDGEGHGKWLPWLQQEFDWSNPTALRFMRVHEMVSTLKNVNLTNLDLDISALYLLAAPANEKVREKVIDAVAVEIKKTGRRATHQIVKKAVDKAHGRKPKPTPEPRARKLAEAKQEARAREIVRPLVAAGKSIDYNKLGKEHGMAHVTFEKATRLETVLLHETTKIESLSKTAKDKLEIAKRMIERKLKAEHALRMRGLDEEVRKKVVERSKDHVARLDELEAKARDSERMYRNMIQHKVIFTSDQFRTILMCLHPDGERTTTKLAEAFRLFNGKKSQLTGEK
jgi:hypothetical protein